VGFNIVAALALEFIDEAVPVLDLIIHSFVTAVDPLSHVFSSSGLVKPFGHFTCTGASPTWMLFASTLSPSSNWSLSPARKISRSFQSPGGQDLRAEW
jgi:hypothetical protein